MPTYGYRCSQCKHTFEEMQKITADALKTCPECKKDTLCREVGGGVGLSFKGSGFYINDYASNRPKEEKKPSPATATAPAISNSSCCPCNKTSCSS
jgi:putative FmdB family regulatory protein